MSLPSISPCSNQISSNQKSKTKIESERERERDPPEGLGENEKGREAHGVGGVVEEESGAVTEI